MKGMTRNGNGKNIFDSEFKMLSILVPVTYSQIPATPIEGRLPCDDFILSRSLFGES